jgi:predicted SAM-dependent methyltransferase/GT2 family glycosyltransferase
VADQVVVAPTETEVVVRIDGTRSISQIEALDAALAGRYRLFDSAALPAEGFALLTLPADIVVESEWVEFLVNTCVAQHQAVGIAVVDAAGSIVHAGGAAAGSTTRNFGQGLNPNDTLVATDRRDAILLAPMAQWIDPTTQSPGRTATAMTNTVVGSFSSSHVARLGAGAIIADEPAVVRVAAAVANTVLIDGSLDSASATLDLLGSVAATSHVIWRRTAADAANIAELAALAELGVFGFDADSYPADGLIAAFECDHVVFASDDSLADGAVMQHMLRSRPTARWVGVAGRLRSGLSARCDAVVAANEIAWWIAADEWSTSSGTNVTPVAPVETVRAMTSIVIPVHGLWSLTKRCLESIAEHTSGPIEVIVVDDASPDDTAAQLTQLATNSEFVDRLGDLRVVTNPVNRGFPGAVNAGIAAAVGEFVCVLNNDTEVTTGWLDELHQALAIDNTVMVGPRSNEISGIQRAATAPPLSAGEVAHRWANRWASARAGVSWRTNRLVGFCLLVRRETLVEHGGLDEGFGRGNFEDDELSNRLRTAGGDLRVADGSVVLHHGSATFASIGGDYLATLASAAKNHHRGTDLNSPIACLVLSNGDHEATQRTVWSLLGLGHHVCVAERGRADALQLRLAQGERLGVEVMSADWTTTDGARAVLDTLTTADIVVVVAAGELVEVTDWGAARAELEALNGAPGAFDLDGTVQIRAHAPTPDLMDHIGATAPIALANICIRTSSEATPVPAHPETDTPETDPSVEVIDVLAIVLCDGPSAGLDSTVASASMLTEAIVVLDQSGTLADADDHPTPVLTLDWNDADELARLLSEVSASQMLILAAGEQLIIDPAAWAADQCVAADQIAVLVGDRHEIRLAPCAAESVATIGADPSAVDAADTHVSIGLRIVPADIDHASIITLLYPELGSHGAIEQALLGEPAMAERLAETMVLDEELRLLTQIRDERPIDWSQPAHLASVGVVIAHDTDLFDSSARLGDTLASLARQTHQPIDIMVVTPPGVELGSAAGQVRHVEHFGLVDHEPRAARFARLNNLGALLVEGDWIAVIDAGDVARPDHLAHCLDVAYADESEYVHGLAADVVANRRVEVRFGLDRQRTAHTFGPLLMASEMRALQLRPSAVVLGDSPAANRTVRLQLIGAIESAAEYVTVTRPESPMTSTPAATGDTTLPTGVALHLGCGPNLLDGWINVDLEEKYSPDLVHDLSQGLPFDDGSVDVIHSEHFFEHLALHDGLKLMAECRRVLRPGGRVRIAMPDLASTVKAYTSNWRDQVWVKDFPRLDSAAHMLNMGMRDWGHQFVYDIEDLTMRLRSVGFDHIVAMPWGASELSELRGLETRADSRLIVEAICPTAF